MRKQQALSFIFCLQLLFAAFCAELLIAAQKQSDCILNRAEVIKAAAKISIQQYPDSDDILVDDFILVKYEKSGTAKTIDDTYVKVLTEKGRHENDSLSFSFTLPYSTVDLLVLEVIKKDGSCRQVDIAGQSKVMINRSQMSSNIYNPNSKVLNVGIPGLAVGDMVHYVSRRIVKKARVPGTWSDYQVFELTSPIKHITYEVNGPVSLPLNNIALKAEVKNTVKMSRRKEAGRIIYSWDVNNVPRMFKEPSMPALYTVVQRLLISTNKDWKDISKWYWNLCKSHLNATAAMKAKVKELTAGITDRNKKIKAIFKWVSQKIRYMGITVEKEAPGYEPHDSSMTFEDRSGVCRDKAALLVAMLRTAGFKAYPVLFYVGPKKDPEVPQPFFNHAISCVQNEDGTYMLMDSTDENTKDLFPSYLNNQSYLVATPGGETLHVSPIIPASANLAEIKITGEINGQGTLKGKVGIKFNGYNDNLYRSYFMRCKPEQRKHFFEGAVKRIAAGAVLKNLEIIPANLQDLSKTLSVQLSFQSEDVLVRNEKFGMFSVPRLGRSIGIVNFILGKTGLQKRKYPLKTDIACGVIEDISIKLDPSIASSVIVPHYPGIKNKNMTWEQKFNWKNGELKGNDKFLITTVEFSPGEYLELKNDLKKIEYNNRKKIITRLPERSVETQNDIKILSINVEYDLEDSNNWTRTVAVKKKVLTYKGKKDNAEISVDYNPAWMDVKLVEARVTNGDTVKEVKPEEINIMDAAWAGSAPRYPAGKTLVASLPGVGIGSVIEYKIKSTYRDHPFFSAFEVFRKTNPLASKKVIVKAPEEIVLKILKADRGTLGIQTNNPEEVIKQEISERDGKRIWEWSVVDQKPVKIEDNQAPLHTFSPSVIVTAGNWGNYLELLRNQLVKKSGQEKVVREKAAELVKGTDSRKDRIIAIRDFMAKNIRTAGPAVTGLPFSAISSAETVLADGYGNSADRAVLLYTLLKAAGFNPGFCLVSGGVRYKKLQKLFMDYPVASVFPSLLVTLKNRGKFLLLGDTNQYAYLGTTHFEDCLALEVATGQPIVIHVNDKNKDRVKVDYNIKLSKTGDALITRKATYFGTVFGAKNKQFSEITPELRHRYYLETMASISQTARPLSDLKTEFAGYPGTESFSVAVKKFAVVEGDFYYFELPKSLFNVLGLRSDTRVTPLYRGTSRRFTVTTGIELPPGFSKLVFAPESFQTSLPGNGGTISVSVEKSRAGRFIIRQAVDFKPSVILPKDYEKLLDINRRLSRTAARTIMLQR